jgi:hypothetical protein
MAITPVSNLAVTPFGAEKVSNGNFSTSGTWTYGQDGGGWAYDGSNHEADCDGSQSTGVDLEQGISAVATENYFLRYTLSNWVAGTVTPQIGGVDGTARGADGTYEDYITVTGTGNLKFQADSDFNGTIDDVSVKKILYSGVSTIGLAWDNSDTYSEIDIQYDKGAGWITYESGLSGSTTSYNVEDIVPNILYNFRLVLFVTGETAVYSNTDNAGCFADAITDEIKTSESVTDYATGSTVSDTITDTVYVTDYVADATDIITNYAYYVATADGKVYEYSGFYKSDGGTAITAQWESKETDFAEQDIQNSDKFKTVEFVRLHYMDKSAGALIDVRVSTDGGANWTTETKNIGTGSNKGKTKDFHFTKTGQIFKFSVRSVSTSDEFQWAGLEVFYSIGGDYFES